MEGVKRLCVCRTLSKNLKKKRWDGNEKDMEKKAGQSKVVSFSYRVSERSKRAELQLETCGFSSSCKSVFSREGSE